MSFRRHLRTFACVALAATALSAHATLPAWLQHIVGASSVEAALYRTMHLPQADVLYPRPPKEAQGELARQISTSPEQAELYALRARTDEAALDVAAAEQDWKQYAARSKDSTAAKLELANFYRRRLETAKELNVLWEVATAQNPQSEKYADPAKQRSWLAFNRSLDLIARQGLPQAETTATYDAFLTRYPDQPAVYARAMQASLEAEDYTAAQALISRYRLAFPKDAAFPVRAQALLEYSRGNIDRALAVYEQAYQPLWPADLVKSYFALLEEAHRQRAFVAAARATLAANPDGPAALNALTRIFYYDQQGGRLPQAQQTLDTFRIAREQRGGAWTPEDLNTLATLERATGNYAEAARYNYALASASGSLPDGQPAAQAGLGALTDILLSAPEQPLAFGAGNLSLYRDIATLDQGPGYWNGILSLWLNGTSPASEYQAENEKAQSYFHRAKAAELLAQLDAKFPGAPQRATLHAQLIQALTQYGEPQAIVDAGKRYLSDFPNSPARVEIGGLIADAYARQNDSAAEFKLYEQLLDELAAGANGMPLSAAGVGPAPLSVDDPQAAANETLKPKSSAFALDTLTTVRTSTPEAQQYSQLLDRYLARLTATHRLPQALLVLRHQLDHNPADPALYERLASFLQQNNLTGEQEALYKQAAARFQEPGWYDKLARFYLRQQNKQAFTALTRQVTDIFSGTDLDPYFARVRDFSDPAQGGPALAMQLNLYAAKRFPHDLVFIRNLLSAYQSKPTENATAYEALLRNSWWESDDLRQQFFAYLSRTGKLERELAALTPTDANPAAMREQAELEMWSSHFEQASAPLVSLSTLYPAEPELDDRAVSVLRSLAYLDTTPASLQQAVAIETNLLRALPDSPDRLATLGDLYAEATSNAGEDLQHAEPYWRRIPDLHPGAPAGSLTAATIFWDYFQYDDALAQLTFARQRFHQPTLYGYEAGAIEENRRDSAAAIREYVAVVVTPPGRRYFLLSVDAAVDALEKLPSDAADSNLQSTAQSLFNATEARERLLVLAARPATAKLVDEATAAALSNAGTAALILRADVLLAQHRPAELPPLLNAALARATTVEQAEAIGQLARDHALQPDAEANLNEVAVHLADGDTTQTYAAKKTYALNAVYQAALMRQIALSTDPVAKLEYQYQLVAAYEQRKDLDDAGKLIAATYKANPRILGVVRATVDYYNRNVQPKSAIDTLLDAAKAATPALARSFTLEAAAKANDSGSYAQARSLAESQLAATPYDPQVLGLIAASYARANDNAGLKSFYLAHLSSVKTAALAPDERKADTALLRRGLILALTALKDYEGATDQYIALLSAYPEDTGTAQEAALYVLRYKRQPQLLDFLQSTVKQSPRDSRFAILLAQTETTFEDLPAALAAYSQAISVRKDRADLYQARVAIGLRLQQLDPTAADYDRLYLLTYKDPQWQVRLAEIRVRQQRNADAVKALKTAYIDGRPALAQNQFTVAAQLLEWNLIEEARTFADAGRALAGPALLTATDPANAATYARILTRQGHATDALSTLTTLRKAADAAPISNSAMLAELAKQGLEESDAAEFRKTYTEERHATIKTNYNAAITALGNTIDTYYTPEQKLAYAQTLDKLHTTDAPQALAAATAAHLTDREALWRKQQLLTLPAAAQSENLAAYTHLQQSRLAFADLAETLELYAARLAPDQRVAPRHEAAQAWHDAGTPEALTHELKLARAFALAGDVGVRDHFLDLLLRHDAAAYSALTSSANEPLADAAANYVIAHGQLGQAMVAVNTRAKHIASKPELWATANIAVVSLYLAPQSMDAQEAFNTVLQPRATIAERLAPNPATTLTGAQWFAFASRYGIAQLAAKNTSEAEDVLPALLEQSPTLPGPYVDLARTYAEAGNVPAALAEYAHAFELAPNQPQLHNEIAVLQSHAGNAAAALAEWRLALDLLRRTVARNSFSEDFYSTFKTTLDQLGQRKLTATLQPQIDAILEPELKRNGNYRSNELLQAVYQASATPQQGTTHILALSASAANPEVVLEDLHAAAWLDLPSRQTILARRLQLAQTASPSASAADAQTDYAGLRLQLLESYLALGQTAQAQALLDSIPATQQTVPGLQAVRVRIAARTGKLLALLATYTAAPDTAPPLDILTTAANALISDPANALLIRQYVFDQKQLTNTLTAADFLSLAQSLLATGNQPAALALLNRLAFLPSTTPDPNANLDAAAALLESTRHAADAAPFLKSLVSAAPWNADYRLCLAKATANPAAFAALARDSSAPYQQRAEAALALAAAGSQQDLGSGELTLLTASHPAPEAARQPYYRAARIAAAAAPDADSKALLREAIAIQPDGNDATRVRFLLLQSSLADVNPAFPLAVLRDLLQQGSAEQTTAIAEDTADTEDSDPIPASPDDPSTVTLPTLATKLPLSSQVLLATQLSAAFDRDRDLDSAMAWQLAAVQLDQQNPHPEPALANRVDQLRRERRLEAVNATRRPVIGADLRRPTNVRPRLTLAQLHAKETP